MSLVCNIIRTDILHYAILKGYFSSVFVVKAFEIVHNLHITCCVFYLCISTHLSVSRQHTGVLNSSLCTAAAVCLLVVCLSYCEGGVKAAF